MENGRKRQYGFSNSILTPIRNMKLGVKFALVGAGGVMFTAAAMVSLTVFQSAAYNKLARNEVEQLINADLDHITQGVYNLVATENEAVQAHVDNNLHIARKMLNKPGEISLSEERISWIATNQYTGKTDELSLPKFMVNQQWLGQNVDFDVATPIVDDMTHLGGETATIFQRMNKAGDMLRIATTVPTNNGRRAIGTYIPAVNPDGSANPVVSTIMKGGTYHGRAYVVNDWYLTAYEPILDRSGELAGMLYVGVRQTTAENRIRHAIIQTKVGKTGYVYIIGGQGATRGHYIISSKGERDGENIMNVQGRNGRYPIQEIVSTATKLGPGEMATVHYHWQNPGETDYRLKIARLAYFEPWDWIIGTSVYEEELQGYRAILEDGRRNMVHGLMGAAVLIAILAGAAFVMLTLTILKPIREMTEVAGKIAGGDLDQTVRVKSNDEIGALAKSFNQMTENLKRTMEGLSQSEEQYRGIFMNSLEGLFQSTLDGRFISANPAMARILGYDSPEDLIRSVTDIRTQIYLNPDDRDLFLKTLLSKTHHPQLEFRFKRKDGSLIWSSIIAWTVCDSQGEPLYFEGFISDINDRKLAEEALIEAKNYHAEILNTVGDPVFVKNENHGWVLVNDAFCTFLGHTRKEIIGKSDYDFIPKAEADVFWAKDEEVLSSGWGNINEETLTDNLGKIHYIITRKTLYTDKHGAKFIVGIIRDVTDQKRIESERQELEARLSQAQKMESIGTLAGGIAHDFNNILSAIIGYSQLAHEELENPDRAKGDLKEVLKASDRAKDLVRQILTFSRMTETEFSPIAMKTVVKESLKMLRSVIPSNIEIKQRIEASGLVFSDPTQLNQIMINLCTNAVHAMDEDGGTLEIGLHQKTFNAKTAQELDLKPGPYMALTISDTGKGMPEEVMSRIFEPYFTTKELGRGTGLGLSVIHGIVKSHHGSIRCRSELGRGTTFETYLPVIETAPPDVPEVEPPPLPGGHERILYVDDEEALTNMAAKMLGRLGYSVTPCCDSRKALDLFKSDPEAFDLVITDMTMPSLTGDRMATEMMATRPDLPVILCTGFNEHITEERARKIGIREFVLKPTDSHTLAQSIRRALGATTPPPQS